MVAHLVRCATPTCRPFLDVYRASDRGRRVFLDIRARATRRRVARRRRVPLDYRATRTVADGPAHMEIADAARCAASAGGGCSPALSGVPGNADAVGERRRTRRSVPRGTRELPERGAPRLRGFTRRSRRLSALETRTLHRRSPPGPRLRRAGCRGAVWRSSCVVGRR